MNRIVGVLPTIAALMLLLLAATSPSDARPRPSGRGDRATISGYGDDEATMVAPASEVRDLLSAGNSPRKSVNDKKRMKNTAGKSDEGGFYKTYGSDAEGEKGYLKQTYSKGDHGYKTLDTFHKKDGDNYGFEEHTAFGKARGRDKGGKAARSGSHTSKGNDAGDHEGAGTIVDTHYVAEGGDKADEGDEGAESGESVSYSDGGDGGHYSADGGDAGEYSEGDSDGGNYGNSDGYNEQYSSGGGDEGSYGSSSSYSHDGDGGGEYY